MSSPRIMADGNEAVALVAQRTHEVIAIARARGHSDGGMALIVASPHHPFELVPKPLYWPMGYAMRPGYSYSAASRWQLLPSIRVAGGAERAAPCTQPGAHHDRPER